MTHAIHTENPKESDGSVFQHNHSNHPAPLWDDTLIRRHDLTGPRYTSYPTAPQFSVLV